MLVAMFVAMFVDLASYGQRNFFMDILEQQDGVVLGASWLRLASDHWSTSNRHSKTQLNGYLVPHACLLCGLGGHWCSSLVYYLKPLSLDSCNLIGLSAVRVYA